jgi:hypothetical protein
MWSIKTQIIPIRDYQLLDKTNCWCRGRDSSPRLLDRGVWPYCSPDYESGALARLGYPGKHRQNGGVGLFSLNPII